LQTAGLWADVRDIKTAQATLTTNLQEQLEAQKAAVKLAIDTADFGAASEIMQSLPLSPNSYKPLKPLGKTAINNSLIFHNVLTLGQPYWMKKWNRCYPR